MTEAGPALKRSERLSVAVLPFANMSEDPEQEHFTDGITNDIIADLSRIAGLTVIARSSSFAYKGTALKIPDVGAELGPVRHRGQRSEGRRRSVSQLSWLMRSPDMVYGRSAMIVI